MCHQSCGIRWCPLGQHTGALSVSHHHQITWAPWPANHILGRVQQPAHALSKDAKWFTYCPVFHLTGTLLLGGQEWLGEVLNIPRNNSCLCVGGSLFTWNVSSLTATRWPLDPPCGVPWGVGSRGCGLNFSTLHPSLPETAGRNEFLTKSFLLLSALQPPVETLKLKEMTFY